MVAFSTPMTENREKPYDETLPGSQGRVTSESPVLLFQRETSATEPIPARLPRRSEGGWTDGHHLARPVRDLGVGHPPRDAGGRALPPVAGGGQGLAPAGVLPAVGRAGPVPRH